MPTLWPHRAGRRGLMALAYFALLIVLLFLVLWCFYRETEAG